MAVDDQLELGGLLDGEVGRPGAVEDLDVISALASCPACTRLASQRSGQSSLTQEAEAMVHVGVDLHKRMSQIAVLTEDGEIAQRRLANEPARLEAFFAQLPPRTPVAIEASGTWWWLVDLLERSGQARAVQSQTDDAAVSGSRKRSCCSPLMNSASGAHRPR
ncbi:MAG: hypothetical protein DMD96_34060 [Candidatus Rokuibacteriota bacterium]|nr:MAG: hypothetical protein DMD96_34060 [Candidatus Rokubacteria bacterium]